MISTRQPVHMAETLSVGSLEEFVTPAEITQLLAVIDAFLAAQGPARFGDRRTSSIHEVPGHNTAQTMAFYEPAGRVEISEIPVEAEQLLQAAFDRARPALGWLLPSVTTCRPWTYVEYGPGQHITAHLDGIAPDPLSWPRQIAGISIVVDQPRRGGEFFVETVSNGRLWDKVCTDPATGYTPGTRLAHEGADQSADWFRTMTRTRWNVNPAVGTALLYGSQLTHGTEPVIEGRARKFISWLIAETN